MKVWIFLKVLANQCCFYALELMPSQNSRLFLLLEYVIKVLDFLFSVFKVIKLFLERNFKILSGC